MEGEERWLWVPVAPALRQLADCGQIVEERDAEIAAVRNDEGRTVIEIEKPEGFVLDVAVWELGKDLARELDAAPAHDAERRRHFLWGSHTTFARPSDLYRHLVFGHVYENRRQWPHYWRICSENDAHALYVALTGLYRATGKRIYDLLRRQVILSVLDRQGEDGGWRHGEWTDLCEAHFRLHASALHLLMDAADEFGPQGLEEPLERGIAFLVGHADRLEDGPWFLHDSLETSPERMRHSPFRWVESRALGKSPANMLVLNTHLDTLVALARRARRTGDPALREAVAGGRRTAARLLGARPAEPLYRLLCSAANLSFLPRARGRRLPWPLRAWKRIGWKYVLPRMHHIRARFPRLVMPGGYVERAVTLQGSPLDYHAINVMDMARAGRVLPDDRSWLVRLAEDGARFVERYGILERWAEEERWRYALGFWCEALYHLCLLDRSGHRWRHRLAEAVVAAERAGVGVAPSLLGGNAEAVPPSAQRPTPSVDAEGLRLVNLCAEDGEEWLLVNVSGTPQRFPERLRRSCVVKGSSGGPRAVPESLGPGDWLLLGSLRKAA